MKMTTRARKDPRSTVCAYRESEKESIKAEAFGEEKWSKGGGFVGASLRGDPKGRRGNPSDGSSTEWIATSLSPSLALRAFVI
jgi:hypothetical protein